MSSLPLPEGLKVPLTGLGLCILATMPAFAASDDVTLDEPSMSKAIGYLASLSGQDISAEDGAWLKQRWGLEFETSPQTVATQVDELALSLERQQQGQDQLALANGRIAMVKNTYCAARQSSDPHVHRLGDILAPDDLVLAADCALGLVVTRFDVDGLVASHALTAAATGQEHDVQGDRGEILTIIEDGFADAQPAEKALIANGELRHAILARFWSRIEGTPEQQAVVDEVRSAALSDLRGTTRQLENLALSRLGKVDYLAKVGDAKLTAEPVSAYRQWLERIAGYSFTTRDLDWLQQVIVDEFREDPEKTLGEVAGIRDMNSAYQRTDGAEAKNGLVSDWAADLYCYLNASGDPEEKHLADIVFRRDPVTEADCQAGQVIRKRQMVLAEAQGQRLTEQDVAVSHRFASMLLGRPLLPEEEAVIRDDDVESFSKDPNAWREQNTNFQRLVHEIEGHGDTFFLAMDERKKLFDPAFCALKESDDPFADAYLTMFRRGNAIVHEDCDQQFVTTEREVEAIVSFINFLTLINERPPLGEAETEELRQSLASQNLNGAESTMTAVNEWWSLLSLEEKAAKIAEARENGVTPEADQETVKSFVNMAKLDVVVKNTQRKQCQMMAIIAQGNVNIFAAKQGRSHLDTNGDLAGFSGSEYATLVTTNNMFAEFCN